MIYQVVLGRRGGSGGIMGVAQVVDEFDFRLEQWSRRSRAVVATEHPVFASVVHAEMYL